MRLRTGLFHRATTRMTPKKETKFTRNAVATPVTAMIRPANAGPTARARLNSIPFSADAFASSTLGTNSGKRARQDGVSNASPAESAKVNSSSNHGVIKPARVRITMSNATAAIHDSVARINLRRSTISPAALAQPESAQPPPEETGGGKGQQKEWQGRSGLDESDVTWAGMQ